MTAFDHLDEIEPLVIWPGVVGRAVVSEQATFSYLELEPDTHVPEHQHVNEQVGILLGGSVRFRIGEEERDLRPRRDVVHPGRRPTRGVGGPGRRVAYRGLRAAQGRLGRPRAAPAVAAAALCVTTAYR